jgi:hypothetical protein
MEKDGKIYHAKFVDHGGYIGRYTGNESGSRFTAFLSVLATVLTLMTALAWFRITNGLRSLIMGKAVITKEQFELTEK